ncbi:MAG: hypothetical protein IPJ40_07985 [Saprospirales bacterium]|nr:hypothetical protein [Saprospirales bacterium]
MPDACADLTTDVPTCTNDTDGACRPQKTTVWAAVTSTGGTRSDSNPLNDPWPLGPTTITWTFTDGTNSTTCTQTVVVTDDDAPACPTLAQVDLTTDAPTCTNDTDVSVPTAEDNCVGTVTSTGGTRDDSGSLNDPWPLGPTTITWTFTDGTNSTTCTQTVVVTDDDAPACPTLAQVDLTTDAPNCTNDTDVSVPTAEDNCVGTVTSTGGTRDDSGSLNDPLAPPWPRQRSPGYIYGRDELGRRARRRWW